MVKAEMDNYRPIRMDPRKGPDHLLPEPARITK